MATTVFSVLPEEMETEVLLRLPVKSIIRFSAVCRRWAALLCSEEFRAARTKLPESWTTTDPAAQLLSLHLTPRTAEKSTEVRSGDGRPLLTLDSVRVEFAGVGVASAPCRGLILLHDTDNAGSGCYHVVNAATRAVATIPPPRQDRTLDSTPSSAGLGFDARTKEYKVVRVFCTAELTLARCEVYTLSVGDHRWRPPASYANGVRLFGAALFATVYHLAPVFADRFLHWLVGPTFANPATGESRQHVATILSFSVSEETFSSRVRQPPFEWSMDDAHLVELEGRLCMVRDLRGGSSSSMEIWSYDAVADGGDGVWSLEHRIDLAQHAKRDLLTEPQYVRVVGASVGKIKVIFVGTSKGNVVAYDPIRQTLETILQLGGGKTTRETFQSLPRVSLLKDTLSPVHYTAQRN